MKETTYNKSMSQPESDLFVVRPTRRRDAKVIAHVLEQLALEMPSSHLRLWISERVGDFRSFEPKIRHYVERASKDVESESFDGIYAETRVVA